MSDSLPTLRRVPDSEEISIRTLVQKYNEGCIVSSDGLNVGWPEELHISGQNAIRLLMRLRDDAYQELNDVRRALDRHKVPGPKDLSQADRIHLLVGMTK